MRKTTYAYNSVVFGILLGLLVGASTQNTFLGVVVMVVVTVAGYYLIRLIEKSLDKGLEKAADVAVKAYKQHKDNKTRQSSGTSSHDKKDEAGQNPKKEEYYDDEI